MAHVDLTLIIFYILYHNSNNYIQVRNPLFDWLSIHTYWHFGLYTLLLKQCLTYLLSQMDKKRIHLKDLLEAVNRVGAKDRNLQRECCHANENAHCGKNRIQVLNVTQHEMTEPLRRIVLRVVFFFAVVVRHCFHTKQPHPLMDPLSVFETVASLSPPSRQSPVAIFSSPQWLLWPELRRRETAGWSPAG